MADDEVTREVLFADWEGPDKTGLTIEQASGGEIFVKEVKGESPAARSGKVYEGDQIVGATIYFDNMSSEETAELLKTLNKHKVGLKLQNKGDKSPCHSPLSTPCRSPMGTLTWEGRLGATSPDVILSGDDEDYKRIYTRKIKPRLKSEDLAEGVDVRTERHSSTSSDGSTITTITRRITTYTVDMPSGISEELELSSPEFKGLQHKTGDGSPRMRILHSSSSGKVETDDSVFESTGIRVKSPNVEVTSHEGTEILRGSAEKGARSIRVSEALRDSTKSGTMHVTIGGSGGAGVTSNDENGGSINLPLPGKINQISTTSMDKTQTGGPETSLVERTVKTSEVTISQPHKKGSSYVKVRTGGDSEDIDTAGEITTGFSSHPGEISLAGKDINIRSSKWTDHGKNEGETEIKSPDVKTDRKEGDPKMKMELNVQVPKTEDIKTTTNIDTEGKKVDFAIKKGGTELPKVKIASTEVKPPEVELPSVDVKLSKETTVIKAYDVHIKGPKNEMEGQHEKFNESKNMSNISASELSMADGKFDLKGPKHTGVMVVSTSKIEGDIKSPQVKIKSQEMDIDGIKGGFKMPKIKMPSVITTSQKLEGTNVDIKMKGPEVEGDIDVTIPKIKGEIKVPAMDTEKQERGAESCKGGIKIPQIRMPSVDLKGQKVEAASINVSCPKPNIDVKSSGAMTKGADIDMKGLKLEGDVDVKMPNIKGDIKAPEIEIEGPGIDIRGHKDGIKMPNIKMPSFEIKGQKHEGPDVDINLPKANIDVKAPDVDIKGPDVDIEGPNAKLKGPKFSMPTLSGPKISMPDVDFNLKGPQLKGDVDVNVPKAKADIKTPDIDIKAPEIDIVGRKGGFEMPKINMPSLNIKGPKFESPDVDINLKGTKLEGDMDVKVPKIKGDIKAPDVDIEGPDIDIEGHKGGIKMPKFKMPAFGLKGQKLEGPDVDINLPKANIDVKAPDVDIKGPEVDIEGPNAKLKGPKFNMPSLSGSKISMPDVDFNLKGPKLKGDVDVSVPKIEGNIRSPEIDIQGPEFNVEGQKGGLELPKIRMPSFGSKGPNLAGVDVDIDFPKAELEGPDVKIDVKDMSPKKSKFKMPKVGFKSPKVKGPETDVKLEHGEINIKGTSGSLENIDLDVGISGSKTKGSKFKMPKFGLKAPKVDMPEVDLNLPKSGAEINTPDIKIAAPEVNIESSSGSLKGPKVKLPDITGPKISMPDMELNLKGPEIKTDGVKGSDVDIGLPQACGADVDFESPGGKIKGPHFKMPNISGPQISMPDLDFKLKGSKLEGDVSAPKIEGKISTPKTDIKVPEVDIDGSKGGLKMPQIKMPSVDIKGPRMDSSDVTISLPKSNINTGEPKVDIKVPDVDVVGPDAKLNVSKLKMTTTSGSIIPDWDISLKTPKLEGDMDVSKTKLKITTPEVDIKGPKLDIEVPKGGSELPKIKLPSGPEVDVNLPKADIDMKACEMNIKAPEVEKGSCSDHEKTGITFPKFKGPKFAMKSPEIEGSKSTTKAPILSVGAKDSKTEVNFPDTEASLDAPDIDINVKGKKGKFKIPKVKGKAKKPEVDIETTEVDVGVDTPNIHTKGAKAKKSIFGKLHFPDVEFDIKSPTLKGDGSFSEGFKSPDADLPSVSFNTASDGSGADRANVCLEGQDIKVNTQNISMPSAKGSSEISANVSGSATSGLQYPEGKVTFSKIKVPKFGLLLPKAEGQKDERKGKPELAASAGMHIESPSVSGQVSSQNIEIPSPELKHSEGKVKVKMPKLFGKSKAKGSSTGDLHESEAVLSTSGKESKTSKIHSGELIGGKFELEGDPGISVSTKGKSASLDLFKKSKHQSPSLTNEGSLAVSSPSAHLEAEGGDISLDLGGSKVKDKKGKLKFGTFGGFGSKSKGSYEVTLGGDSEAGMEGSVDVSVPSKKSRLSSSSSSDSGSKSGLKFPK